MTTPLKRDDVLKVIVEAREKGNAVDLSYANLQGADLYAADLQGANLYAADLQGANLYGANLYAANLRHAKLYAANLRHANMRHANLQGADLYAVDLGYADLHAADLRGVDLQGADLLGANLYGADLQGANLHGADLLGADLRHADLHGAIWYGLYLNGMSSGDAIHVPTSGGWKTSVGCWTGTLDELEAMIATNTGWPEAVGEECDQRRPSLQAFIALARAHEACCSEAVDEIIAAQGGGES